MRVQKEEGGTPRADTAKVSSARRHVKTQRVRGRVVISPPLAPTPPPPRRHTTIAASLDCTDAIGGRGPGEGGGTATTGAG